jgi:hypothetical protein
MASKPNSNQRQNHWDDLHAQRRLPFPIVMAGLGLLMAWFFPGWMTGGQGFLLGFFAGILLPGFVTLLSRSRQAPLNPELRAAIAEMLQSDAVLLPSQETRHERTREIPLGKGSR